MKQSTTLAFVWKHHEKPGKLPDIFSVF